MAKSVNDLIISGMEAALKESSKEVIKQIELQNFIHKGSLIKSVRPIVKDMKKIIRGFITMNPYGFILNKGVSPGNVPYSGSHGKGGVSKYIQALIYWARSKFGLSLRNATSRAFAIANVHKKQGIASRNSIVFSKNGKRKGFINDAVSEIADNIGLLFKKNVANPAFQMLITEFKKYAL